MRSMTRAIVCGRARQPVLGLGVGGLERAGTVEGGVEFDREARAVVLHQRELLLGVGARLVVAHAPLGGSFEQADCGGEPRQ